MIFIDFADECAFSQKGEAIMDYEFYYVNDNAQVNGDHEVHQKSCSWLELAPSKTYLGYYTNCMDAIAKAKTIYNQVDGCVYCCNPCHKS